MSKLLYAEKTSSYISRRYGTLVAVMTMTFFAIIVPIGIALAPEGDVENRLQVLLISSAFAALMIVVTILAGVLPALAQQRFEIYDDRMSLPKPRKISLLTRSPETIMKSDIQRAFLDYTENGGAFKRKISGMDDYGLRGEWRCVLTFKNGETFILTHQRVNVTGDCIPALKEFVRGIEE